MQGLEEFEIGWNEDLDLNAAAAAIAPLLGQDQLRIRSGDQLKVALKGGMYIKRIRAADESGGGSGGYLTIEGVERNIYFGKYVGDNITDITFHGNGGLGLFIPKNTSLDCVGNKSGSGAEQHVVLLSCYSPALPESERIPLDRVVEEFVVGVKTGTLVAATFGAGSQTILDNLEDSEEKFSISPKKKYVLIGMINGPSAAGYGVVGVRMNDRKIDRAFPAKILVGQAKYFPMDDENERPMWGYGFDGDESPVAMGAGVGTTSIEAGFHIGVVE